MSEHETVPFLRVSGAGNDFLALAEPEGEPTAAEIRAWCRRGVSLGADGVFVLRRRVAAGAARPVVDMAYFNADGGAADLCLNGTRCAAQVAFHLGWADGEVEVETGAGPVAARRVDETAVAVELPRPEDGGEEVELVAGGRTVRGRYLVVGVPHLVVDWPAGLADAPLAELGPPLRRHPRFPRGANVSFVHLPAADRLEIRTWERGVEAETLACGTGVLAAVAVGMSESRLALPVTVLTAGGFAMTVAAAAGDPGRWSLAGDARVLAAGRLLPAAAELPEPPGWTRP